MGGYVVKSPPEWAVEIGMRLAGRDHHVMACAIYAAFLDGVAYAAKEALRAIDQEPGCGGPKIAAAVPALRAYAEAGGAE